MTERENNQSVTVEDLLRKIGALVVQADILQSQVVSLQQHIGKLEAEAAKKADDKK